MNVVLLLVLMVFSFLSGIGFSGLLTFSIIYRALHKLAKSIFLEEIK